MQILLAGRRKARRWLGRRDCRHRPFCRPQRLQKLVLRCSQRELRASAARSVIFWSPSTELKHSFKAKVVLGFHGNASVLLLPLWRISRIHTVLVYRSALRLSLLMGFGKSKRPPSQPLPLLTRPQSAAASIQAPTQVKTWLQRAEDVRRRSRSGSQRTASTGRLEKLFHPPHCTRRRPLLALGPGRAFLWPAWLTRARAASRAQGVLPPTAWDCFASRAPQRHCPWSTLFPPA